MYIWTYIILHASKREHAFPLQLYSSRYRYSVRSISLKGRNVRFGRTKMSIYLLSIYIYICKFCIYELTLSSLHRNVNTRFQRTIFRYPYSVRPISLKR